MVKTTTGISNISEARLMRSLPPTPPIPHSLPPDHDPLLAHSATQPTQQQGRPLRSWKKGDPTMDLIVSRTRDEIRTLVLSENLFPSEAERKELIEQLVSIAAGCVLHDHRELVSLS